MEHLNHLITHYGYWAVAVGCLLEGETLLILAGIAARRGLLELPWVLAVGACAGALSDVAFFTVGRWRGQRGMKLTVCTSCVLGRSGFAETLRAALAKAGIAAQVETVECMSGCTRPSTLAARAPGKTAYLFGDIAETDLPDILAFARLYRDSADGTFADARPLGALRFKAMARIPG